MSPCPHVIPTGDNHAKSCLVGKLLPLSKELWIRDDDLVAKTRNTRLMKTSSTHSPFRRWRRTAAFKQKEIARLLGLDGTTQISRVEQGRRVPGLALAVALEVLTGMPLHEIVPAMYDRVEEETLARVTAMLMEIENSPHVSALAKCKYLRSCQERVITRHKNKTMHAET